MSCYSVILISLVSHWKTELFMKKSVSELEKSPPPLFFLLQERLKAGRKVIKY